MDLPGRGSELVSRQLLAVFLLVFAACTTGGSWRAVVLAARDRDRLMLAVSVVAGLGIAAVLCNAAVDLW